MSWYSKISAASLMARRFFIDCATLVSLSSELCQTWAPSEQMVHNSSRSPFSTTENNRSPAFSDASAFANNSLIVVLPVSAYRPACFAHVCLSCSPEAEDPVVWMLLASTGLIDTAKCQEDAISKMGGPSL